MENGKKITKATFKSFIRKNQDRLFIKCQSRFDGMTDGVENIQGAAFRPAQPEDRINSHENTLGIAGVWLVGSSRDYFRPYQAEGFTGIEVMNCCGSFVLAIPA